MPVAIQRALYRIWCLRRAVVLLIALPGLGLLLTAQVQPLIAATLPALFWPLLQFAVIVLLAAALWPIGFLQGLRLGVAFTLGIPLIAPIWEWVNAKGMDDPALGPLILILPTAVLYPVLGVVIQLLWRVPWAWPLRDQATWRVAAPAGQVFDFYAPPVGGPYPDPAIRATRAEGDVMMVTYIGSPVETPERIEADRESGTIVIAALSGDMGITESTRYQIRADGDGSVVEHTILVDRIPVPIAAGIWLEDAYQDQRRFMRDRLEGRPGVSIKRTKLNMILAAEGGDLVP